MIRREFERYSSGLALPDQQTEANHNNRPENQSDDRKEATFIACI